MKNKQIKKNTKIRIDPVNFINDYILEITKCLFALDRNAIAEIIDVLVTAYKKNRNVFIIGNGGSAATASHMACDLGKGTLQRIYDNKEKRLSVVSLTDNVALITAYANDLSFDDIFSQQLRNLVKKGDVVIALSGSGNSVNVVKAVIYANESKAITVGILGFKTGGKLAKIVNHKIIVDSNHYGPIEDIQLILNHIIAAWIAKIKNIHDGKINKKGVNRAVPFSSL